MLGPAVLEALPLGLRGTRPVVRFLRDCGAIPDASCVDGAGPVGLLVAEFRGWLAGERGLAVETVRCYGNHAHTFLAWLGDPLEQVLAGLEAGTVTTFMVEHCEQVSCANAKASVTALRALLRFLHLAGHVPTGLAGAVPAVAGWRQATLPRGLEAGEAERLLAGCDRSTDVGRRDFAVLILLAQLEVADLNPVCKPMIELPTWAPSSPPCRSRRSHSVVRLRPTRIRAGRRGSLPSSTHPSWRQPWPRAPRESSPRLSGDHGSLARTRPTSSPCVETHPAGEPPHHHRVRRIPRSALPAEIRLGP
jgi:hypothetical protein